MMLVCDHPRRPALRVMRRAVAASNGGQTGEKHKEAGSIIKKESKEGDEFQDWQLDSNYDSNTLTSTRDLEAFMATLGVSSFWLGVTQQRGMQQI